MVVVAVSASVALSFRLSVASAQVAMLASLWQSAKCKVAPARVLFSHAVKLATPPNMNTSEVLGEHANGVSRADERADELLHLC